MAVYTHLSNETIGVLLREHYALGTFDFAVGIAQGVENSNYLVAMRDAVGAEQKYILTLYEKRVEASELPFFLGLMQHLGTRGFSCPQPLARNDGALWGVVNDRPAALVSFLHGQSRTEIMQQHAASVGAALGALHRAGEGFGLTRPNQLSLEGWRQIHAKIRGKLDEIQPGLEALVEEELGYAAQHWAVAAGLPQGVIHADLFPDNVFFIDRQVSGVIDFYFACNDALAYDVAIAINAWCFEANGEFNAEKAQTLLAQYQTQRALSAAEIQALPVLLRGAALRFLLTRAHDWIFRKADALVTPLDPLEYAGKLRFHQQGGAWRVERDA